MNKINIYQKIFIVFYIFCVLIFICHFLYVGSGVWGDGRYYYSYLRSAVLDRNLDFTNEFEFFHIPIQYSHTGMIINKFNIGPFLFWLPFFLIAHLLTSILMFLGGSIKVDGYSFIYQISVGIASVTFAIWGLYLCFVGLKKIVKPQIALISSLTIFFASNLFFYGSIDPINSHSLSFFSSSLLFYLIIKYWHQKLISISDVIFLGITTGLIALIRNQDLIWSLMVFGIIIFRYRDSNIKKIVSLLVYLVSVFVLLIPQFWLWWLMLGKINSPYLLLGEKFYWLQPQIFNVLFSSYHGLFYYSPILIFSIWGLVLVKKDFRILDILSILIFILQTWIVGSWHSWWAGESYGNRMFISVYPLLIWGLCMWLTKFRIDIKKYVLFIFLIILNFGMIIRYLLSI